MNIIVAGCGKVGSVLAEQLSREGHDITVIDEDSDVVQHTSNAADVRGIVGNVASYNIQQEAGIGKADLLIAVTNADEVNLLSCLIAKKAGDCQTIARVRNPVYHQEIQHIKEELGLSLIRWQGCFVFHRRLILILLQEAELNFFVFDLTRIVLCATRR